MKTIVEILAKVGEIWKSLPVVPRRVFMGLVGLAFVAFLTLRIWLIATGQEPMPETFLEFIWGKAAAK